MSEFVAMTNDKVVVSRDGNWIEMTHEEYERELEAKKMAEDAALVEALHTLIKAGERFNFNITVNIESGCDRDELKLELVKEITDAIKSARGS